MSKNCKLNFIGILLSSSTQWLDKTYICAVIHCIKLQELKCNDIYLQTSILVNTLNFCIHVHIMISNSYKFFPN
jgi:hypothetical protein